MYDLTYHFSPATSVTGLSRFKFLRKKPIAGAMQTKDYSAVLTLLLATCATLGLTWEQAGTRVTPVTLQPLGSLTVMLNASPAPWQAAQAHLQIDQEKGEVRLHLDGLATADTGGMRMGEAVVELALWVNSKLTFFVFPLEVQDGKAEVSGALAVQPQDQVEFVSVQVREAGGRTTVVPTLFSPPA